MAFKKFLCAMILFALSAGFFQDLYAQNASPKKELVLETYEGMSDMMDCTIGCFYYVFAASKADFEARKFIYSSYTYGDENAYIIINGEMIEFKKVDKKEIKKSDYKYHIHLYLLK